MEQYETIRHALNYLDSNDRELWIKIGAAIKDELGEDGFHIWNEWSKNSQSYHEADAKSVWKSLKQGHIHIATLFYYAKANGYQPNQTYQPLSATEIAQRKEEALKKQQQAEQERLKANNKAQKTAQYIWSKAEKADLTHPYLKAKGINNINTISHIRQNKYQDQVNLLIPVYANKQLVNLQTIDSEGNKRFLQGGQVHGAYSIIGEFKQNNHVLFMAEGFATAASLYEATGNPVIVAFNAQNLIAVAERLSHNITENQTIIIAADNDSNQIGINKALEAAQLLNGQALVQMPKFTQSMIQQYQALYGNNALPSDFNDLHQLSGIEAVQQQLVHIDPSYRAMWKKAERSDWGNFPPLIRNGSLEELKNTDGYQEAKAGNPQAALNLVESLLSEQTIVAIQEMANGRNPIIVGVRAEENKGKNQIPDAMALVLSKQTGWELDTNLYQISYAGRTGSNSSYRLAFPAVFGGTVQAGRDYLIVDDNSTMGGTIAGLKGYIENRGGRVIGAAVMSARATGLELIPTDKQLNDIQNKHGDTANAYFQKTFGYGISRLTRSEAGTVRSAPTFDTIRNRINEARISANKKYYAPTIGTEPSKIESSQCHPIERDDGSTKKVIEHQNISDNPSTNLNQSAISQHDMADFLSSTFSQENMMQNHTPTPLFNQNYAIQQTIEQAFSNNAHQPYQDLLDFWQHKNINIEEFKKEVLNLASNLTQDEYQRLELFLNNQSRYYELSNMNKNIINGGAFDTESSKSFANMEQEQTEARLNHQLESAKMIYMDKAQKLNKTEKQKLMFYENNIMKIFNAASSNAQLREQGLTNYYEQMAQHMKGSKLDLPHPTQSISTEQPLSQEKTIETTQQVEIVEMER